MTTEVTVRSETKTPDPAPARRPWVLHPAIRVGFALLVAGLFAASYAMPLWVSRFVAPQYPYGLNLYVYLDHVEGDTFEVDLLNHYVGLRPIEQMACTERKYALGMLVVVCLAAVVASIFPKSLWQVLFVLPLILFPLGMLLDLTAWLYYAGHSLDPDSALGMSVKPFTPKLIGTQKIANFDVTSSLGSGTYLQLAAALLLACAAGVGWRLSRRRKISGASTC